MTARALYVSEWDYLPADIRAEYPTPDAWADYQIHNDPGAQAEIDRWDRAESNNDYERAN